MRESRMAWGAAMVMVLCACGSSPFGQPAATASTSSEAINVTGTIERGPVATCPADEPCDPPAVASRLVFTSAGGSLVTVRVAADGSFALHLEPGAYTIAAAPPAFGGSVEPSSVRVPKTGSVVLRLRIVRALALTSVCRVLDRPDKFYICASSRDARVDAATSPR